MVTIFKSNSDQPEASVEDISPSMAQRYLSLNDNNRNIASRTVATYAAAMTAGDWQLSDPIKFDTKGRLIDGQHRLAAIAKANVTVKMFVVRNLDPKAREVIDTGRSRTAADVMKMQGYSQYSIVASAAKLLVAYDYGWITKVGSKTYPRKITSSEISRFVEANPQIHDHATLADHVRKSVNLQPSVLCMTSFILSNIDEEAASAFFANLADLRTDGYGDPLHTLLTRIGKRDRTWSVNDSIYVIFRTWNAFRTGEILKQIKKYSGDTEIPKPI